MLTARKSRRSDLSVCKYRNKEKAAHYDGVVGVLFRARCADYTIISAILSVAAKTTLAANPNNSTFSMDRAVREGHHALDVDITLGLR
jgi:hypothetical protein